jgi:TonB family protein
MVTIRVVLDAHGNLLEAEAKSGADKPALVSAALTAVRRAAPFPPVNPAPSAGNSQAVIPIRFELEDVPTIEKGL